MASYISSDPTAVRGKELNPVEIQNKLFSLHDKARFYHRETTSYGYHKFLNDLYTAIGESEDAICEFLLGIMAPKRFGSVTIESIPPYSEKSLMDFLNQGYDFTCRLCEYADKHKLEELCNLSSELQGEFAKAKYFMTLK